LRGARRRRDTTLPLLHGTPIRRGKTCATGQPHRVAGPSDTQRPGTAPDREPSFGYPKVRAIAWVGRAYRASYVGAARSHVQQVRGMT
jgi:hypothetical protein